VASEAATTVDVFAAGLGEVVVVEEAADREASPDFGGGPPHEARTTPTTTRNSAFHGHPAMTPRGHHTGTVRQEVNILLLAHVRGRYLRTFRRVWQRGMLKGMRRVVVGGVLLTLTLLVAGVASAGQLAVDGASASTGVSSLPNWLHKTVRAKVYVNPAAPFVPNVESLGSPIPRSDVTATVAGGKNVQLGLATFPTSTQTYPAISTDGGATWKVDGPLFHVDALQGASVVGGVGALRPHGTYFWGRGGVLIWITYDSGAHWWTVVFGGGVDQLRFRKGTLEAVALGGQVDHGTAIQRFLYSSTDSGKTWKVRRQLDNLPAPR
jgi:hypothetical protein